MAAPKGNQFAIGNNGGRPRIYDKPEEFAAAIDDYFEYIQGELKPEHVWADPLIKEYKRQPEPATITGLALYIGFDSRQSLKDYLLSEEFSSISKKARSRVEYEYEKRLVQGNVAGVIFALKNMGWADTHQLTGANEAPLYPNEITLKLPEGTEINLPSNTDGEI